MKALLLFLTALVWLTNPAVAAAPTSNVPITGLPLTTNVENTAYFAIAQPYTGRSTNDTFKATIATLFLGRTGTNFWQYDGTTLAPVNALFTQITNLVNYGLYAQQHVMFQGSGSYTIDPGMTVIGVANKNSIGVVGSTLTPSGTVLNLDNGNGYGQILIVYNLSTNEATFTMPAEQAQVGDPSKTNRIHGPWTPTLRYESIILRNTGFGWQELGRSPGTNQTENLWVNLGGQLQPVDLTLPVMITNRLDWGPGATNRQYRNPSIMGYNDVLVYKASNGQTAATIGLETDDGIAGVIAGSNSAGFGLLQVIGKSRAQIGTGDDNIQIGSGQVEPNTSGTIDLGSFSVPFKDAYLSNSITLIGYTDVTTLNWNKVVITHTGVGGGVVFSSQSAGTAGDPVPFIFTNAPVMLPQYTKVQKATITPQEGMILMQTDNTPGLRAYVNGAWVMVSTVADP